MRPIDATLIKVPLRCRTKREAISELLDLLVSQGLVGDRDKVLDELLDRESASPTAIGDDAAVPHARSAHVNETACAFGSTLDDGIEFGPISAGGPSRSASLLFLMVSPPSETTRYIKTLAKIARLVKDDRRRNSLKAATDPVEVLELLGDLTRS